MTDRPAKTKNNHLVTLIQARYLLASRVTRFVIVIVSVESKGSHRVSSRETGCTQGGERNCRGSKGLVAVPSGHHSLFVVLYSVPVFPFRF